MERIEKKIMITGAAGAIGSGLANFFGELGSQLILTDHISKKKELISLKEEIQYLYNSKIVIDFIDLANLAEVKNKGKELIKQSDGVDVLINNAGINKIVPSIKLTEREWDDVININLRSAFFLSQEVAKSMIMQKNGQVLFMASQHGVVGNEDRAAYCASKAGLINLSKALAVEWAKYNIRVNCISPTFVIHKNNRLLLESSPFQRNALKEIPLRKYANVSDIVHGVCYLVKAEMVTGHNLVIDGGWTSH